MPCSKLFTIDKCLQDHYFLGTKYCNLMRYAGRCHFQRKRGEAMQAAIQDDDFSVVAIFPIDLSTAEKLAEEVFLYIKPKKYSYK